MRLRNVSFENWLRSHHHKVPSEKWLRELYPWPVLAEVDCDRAHVGKLQRITHDGIDFEITLKSVKFQPTHGTYRYRLFVESSGLGWHARSYADELDICGTPEGLFVTLFHTKKEEPLERIARAFFMKRWDVLNPDDFRTLAVSRFLAASIAGQVAEKAIRSFPLTHYPDTRLLGGGAPMLASGSDLWVGSDSTPKMRTSGRGATAQTLGA